LAYKCPGNSGGWTPVSADLKWYFAPKTFWYMITCDGAKRAKGKKLKREAKKEREKRKKEKKEEKIFAKEITLCLIPLDHPE